jgi:hypothetical protein
MRQHHEAEQTTVSVSRVASEAQQEADLEQVHETAAEENTEAIARVKCMIEQDIYRRRRRGRATFAWLAIWVTPIMLGVMTGRLTDWIASMASRPLLILLYYLLLAVPPLSLLWSDRRGSAKRARLLAELDDVRLIGPLTDTLKVEDRRVQARAGDALTRLLPLLKASDRDLLNVGQRAILCRVLAKPLNDLFRSDLVMLLTRQTHRMAELQAAILKAFEQVGDGKALPIVERLATGEAKTADQQRVQAAASECLPYLQTRAAQERAHQTLLRPSGIAETATDTLLRPAGASEAADAEQLLRPEPDQPRASGPFAPFSAGIKRPYVLVLQSSSAN